MNFHSSNLLNAYQLNRHDWTELLTQHHQSINHCQNLFSSSFKTDAERKLYWSKTSPQFQNFLHAQLNYDLPLLVKQHQSLDGTIKFVFRLQDGLEIESVLLNFHRRLTVCLSTQVGCGMKCSFCLTGTRGLKRSLTTHEIVGQYFALVQYIKKNKLNPLAPKIVFMGEGEPLHNFDAVKKALEILTDPASFNLGAKNITLSTVGLITYLKRWQELPKVNLAFSLHAATQMQREKIIPSAKLNPLDKIMFEIDSIAKFNNRFITFEYTIIENINDDEQSIADLISLLLPRKKYALLNLIPYNPHHQSEWKRPSPKTLDQIYRECVKNGLRTFQRKTLGDDILAACGQLIPIKKNGP